MKKSNKQEDLEFEIYVHEDRVKRCKLEARGFAILTVIFIALPGLPWLLNDPSQVEVSEYIGWFIFAGPFSLLFLRIIIKRHEEVKKEETIIETIKHKLRYLE